MQVDCRDEVLTDGMHTYLRFICSGAVPFLFASVTRELRIDNSGGFCFYVLCYRAASLVTVKKWTCQEMYRSLGACLRGAFKSPPTAWFMNGSPAHLSSRFHFAHKPSSSYTIRAWRASPRPNLAAIPLA
jgi:hypothetical protein